MKIDLRSRDSLELLGGAIVAAGAFAAVLAMLVYTLLPEGSATARKHFCRSLNDLSTTVMNYQGLKPATVTKPQLEAAASHIDEAWVPVSDNADAWSGADDEPVTTAYENLAVAIQSLPDEKTAAQDRNAVEPQLDAFPAAFRETFDGSDCATA